MLDRERLAVIAMDHRIQVLEIEANVLKELVAIQVQNLIAEDALKDTAERLKALMEVAVENLFTAHYPEDRTALQKLALTSYELNGKVQRALGAIDLRYNIVSG